ncbi:S41 family peptidase [Bdellovibrio sp. HCB337]|uniref:S41 family peptidase n=1 Tax=Bdellovibrio sp. HCB337 TaxID=3394358 RepID=UPI0039A4F8A9
MSDNLGYYSQPCIHHNTIVFVSDDDLWSISREGGIAKRLTANIGIARQPKISPDGERIAYVGNDRGQMGLYIISVDGGTPQQLTHFNVENLVGWKDEETILFSSSFRTFGVQELYEFDLLERTYRRSDLGEITTAGINKNGVILMIGRKNRDSARWKRYKGGTAGVLWTRKNAKDKFQRILKNIKTNIAAPHLIGEQIYFISDHEGSANVYRCELDGKGLKRLTDHEDYYVRNLETDDNQLVYQKGADVYYMDLKTGKETKVVIECPTSGVQAQPRFEDAQNYLESYAVSNNLQELFIGSRGHGFSMPVFDGPVMEWDLLRDVRYSLPAYSHDSKYLYLIGNNSQQSDRLIQCDLENRKMKILLEKNDWGVVRAVSHNPKKDIIAIANNRCELFIVDTKTQRFTLVEKSVAFRSFDLTWSPNGRYLAYTTAVESRQNLQIHVYDTKIKRTRMLIQPIVGDSSPCFSLDGQYLYFIGVREFYPVYNATHFDLGFPFGAKPYVVSLTKTAPNPFKASVNNYAAPEKPEEKQSTKKKAQNNKPAEDIEIDFEGIDHRIMPFPLDLKGYEDIRAIPGGVLYRSSEIKADTDFSKWSWEGDFGLYSFKFEENKEERWSESVVSFELCNKAQHVIYRTRDKHLRLVSTSSKPNKDHHVGKKDGWIDLDRIRLQIHPREEWKQMYRETWYLQKEHFWRPDMSKVNWAKTYNNYLPLLPRVKTRAELSDLLWEMQGDLGTSHAYESGGQYLRRPYYNILGLLGAEFEYQDKTKSFKITRIYKGDSWVAGHDSPLAAPAVQLLEGDEIHKVNGHGFQNAMDLEARLQNQNGVEICITIKRRGRKEFENLIVKTLSQQRDLIYRDWVEGNRELVHRKSNGKLGYVHIPNMGPWGYAEFYRYFLTEFSRDGLIVDVRFNGGGHVSQHILKILAQKPMGVMETRHFSRSFYPAYAVRGPIVGITNEQAGSDGDIFSHSFKLLKLGKLIGKRTWGGVIGINMQYSLRDRTSVTQPEFSHWFQDVGWSVENYGTDPDIEVDYPPEDYQAGRDPQLLRAIEEGLGDLKKKPAFNPNIKEYPNLAAPILPKKAKAKTK